MMNMLRLMKWYVEPPPHTTAVHTDLCDLASTALLDHILTERRVLQTRKSRDWMRVYIDEFFARGTDFQSHAANITQFFQTITKELCP
jgi:hypothetical protein